MLSIIQMQYQSCYIDQEKSLYIFRTDKTFSLSSSGWLNPWIWKLWVLRNKCTQGSTRSLRRSSESTVGEPPTQLHGAPSLVNPLMAIERRLVVELLPTLGTFVGLLSRVCSVVHGEVGHPREGFPALAAFKGLLPGVDPVMDGEVRHLREALSALVTLISFFPCVCPLVPVQGGVLAEGLPALAALVGLLP